MAMTLREAREAKKLSQRDVATIVGRTPQAVSQWESGQSMMPADIFLKLCQIYGVSADDIIWPKNGHF